MAEYDDGCMFCGNVVCSCDQVVKPKRSRKAKVEADKPVPAKPKPLPSRAPLAPPKDKPKVERQRISESKVSIEDSIAKDFDARSKMVASPRTKQIPDEELEPVLRAFDFLGMISKQDRARFRHLLDRPEPTGELWKEEN